jgi:uncharacterized membrane protein
VAGLHENDHGILINAPVERVRPEVIRWGEAPWWPKRSLMRFIRSGSGPVVEGTRYRQEVLLPFAPSWDVEVTAVTDSGITRRFLNGMFRGQETVSVAAQPQGSKVDYRMSYRVPGVLNGLLWRLVFRRLHDRNIEQILKNLKAFAEGQGSFA